MRYNIKRLFNEISTHEQHIKSLKSHYEKEKSASLKQDLSYALNQQRHAKSLCVNYIGREVVERLKEGSRLDEDKMEDWEKEPVPQMITFKSLGAINLGFIIERHGQKYEVIDNNSAVEVTAKLVK